MIFSALFGESEGIGEMAARRAPAMLLLLVRLASAASPARWVEVSANGTWPQPRFSHSAVVMPDGETMLLFGGNNFDAVNELFAFNLRRREWSKLKASGDVPSKRYGHQAVVTNDARMIVFGGYNGTPIPGRVARRLRNAFTLMTSLVTGGSLASAITCLHATHALV